MVSDTPLVNRCGSIKICYSLGVESLSYLEREREREIKLSGRITSEEILVPVFS